MTLQEFVRKWKLAKLKESAGSQEHFLDLCAVLGEPTPATADPEGTHYTFERGARKTDGGEGWADVWKRGYFGWEYKGKRKDLAAAYRQLLQYHEALESPPLLVVCDFDRFEVHTKFTNTATKVYAFDLDALLADGTHLEVLRRVFTDPDLLKPGLTRETITKAVAEQIGQVADSMRNRKVPAERAARFLMRLMFCMFAEDIGLLPAKMFSKILENSKRDPERLAKQLAALFQAMAHGGDFGADPVLHFNGGLFKDADVEKLEVGEIQHIHDAAIPDWAEVEPSIFGTLFERFLDPTKRSQIGAHYTSREDIETIIKPVVMAPLRREWDEVRAKCETLWPQIQVVSRKSAMAGKKVVIGKVRKASKPRAAFDKLLTDFVHRLAQVRVLDPACGSGNFLYVAINLLLYLEKEVTTYLAMHGVTQLPQVRPTQLLGIEINRFAQELAQVVIWIGYLQWMHVNGFNPPHDPVLDPIDSVRCMDAILDTTDPAHPAEPEWPEADFIVGNPPFLGGKLLRTNLGDEYVDGMFKVWGARVPPPADLCCYWFEKGRQMIERRKAIRVGLLATQGIRGGANREVLKRIKDSGDIFFAESDRDWILDGANVHVSMVGFDDGKEATHILDGASVATITRGWLRRMRSARRSSRNERSQIYITNAKLGSNWRIGNSTRQSSRPTAGPLI
jgi:type II restriction/modification system DNA methylase subunit YeeA